MACLTKGLAKKLSPFVKHTWTWTLCTVTLRNRAVNLAGKGLTFKPCFATSRCLLSAPHVMLSNARAQCIYRSDVMTRHMRYAQCLCWVRWSKVSVHTELWHAQHSRLLKCFSVTQLSIESCYLPVEESRPLFDLWKALGSLKCPTSLPWTVSYFSLLICKLARPPSHYLLQRILLKV